MLFVTLTKSKVGQEPRTRGRQLNYLKRCGCVTERQVENGVIDKLLVTGWTLCTEDC